MGPEHDQLRRTLDEVQALAATLIRGGAPDEAAILLRGVLRIDPERGQARGVLDAIETLQRRRHVDGILDPGRPTG